MSGGQWQRIALSRAYFRDREIIILDEPTSAIDPIEETQLYHQFFSFLKIKLLLSSLTD
ncbi:ATP-binding cassette domain-containing protein [Streptococcus iniae]